MRRFKKFVTAISALCMLISIVPMALAAPSKPVLKEPINGQIIPFYEVWIRWNDVSNEDHYIMTIRDITNGDSGPLIYNRQRVSKNSTYFVIPTSKLTKGHTYRWCLGAVDSAGNETLCPAWSFRIEYGDSLYGRDTHVGTGGFASASHLDYFVYAKSTSFDDILEAAVNSWNGISSKVYLHRDGNPPGGESGYKIGVFESPSPKNTYSFGYTQWRTGGINGTDLPDSDFESTCDYAEVRIYKQNIIDNLNSNFAHVVRHEIGHALSLKHTNDSSNSIARTEFALVDDVKLLMNKVNYIGNNISTTITTVDRDHLRIKWGA